jgi:hypothetical protein
MAPGHYSATSTAGWDWRITVVLNDYATNSTAAHYGNEWSRLPARDTRSDKERARIRDFARHAPILNIAGVPPVDLKLATTTAWIRVPRATAASPANHLGARPRWSGKQRRPLRTRMPKLVRAAMREPRTRARRSRLRAPAFA